MSVPWCVCKNCGPTRNFYRISRADMPGVFAYVYAQNESRVRSKLELDAPHFKIGRIELLLADCVDATARDVRS